MALAKHLTAWLAGKCMKHRAHLGLCPHVSTRNLSGVDPESTCHICHWQARRDQSTSSTPNIPTVFVFCVPPLTTKARNRWGQIRGYCTLISWWKPDMERLSNKRRKYKQRSINQSKSDKFNGISLQYMLRPFNQVWQVHTSTRDCLTLYWHQKAHNCFEILLFISMWFL